MERSGAHAAFSKNSRAKAGPEVASIDSSQILIMDYQLTELLVAAVEGQHEPQRTSRVSRADLQSWRDAIERVTLSLR